MKPTQNLPRLAALILILGLMVPGTTTAHAENPIPIKVAGFAGKVTIRGPDGKATRVEKGADVSVGSTVSTGPNSWLDLAQGDLSKIRVQPKTQSFTIVRSTLDPKTNHSNSHFNLKNGTVIASANKGAITQGSRYQIQTPEMIARVQGSSLQLTHGPNGTTAIKITGSITLNINGQEGQAPSGQATVALPNGTTQTVTLPLAVRPLLGNISASVNSTTPPPQQQLQQQLNALTSALNQVLGAANLPGLDTITSATTTTSPEQNPYQK